LLLVLVTLAVYSRVLHNPFVSFDDKNYVTRNPHVQAGLTWSTAKWALTSTEASNWHPLTWMSHALDWQIYGGNATGHHLTSLLIHAINVVLLFLLLFKATGYRGRSLLVASLFALHPFNVESVAWIAERKNVLSTLFLLCAFGAYGWYALKPSVQRYLTVIAMFVLGLAAKPMVITLPFLLLLLDYWPLKRFRGFERTQPTTRGSKARKQAQGEPLEQRLTFESLPASKLLLEKLPLIIISLGSAIITIIAQRHTAMRTLTQIPLDERLENALYSYAMYVWKAIWPHPLALYYPHPTNTLSITKLGLALLFLVGVTVLGWTQRTSRPYLLAGWLWYLGTLVPVIGIIQVGDQAMADRYAYVPLLGVFVMIVWPLAEWAEPSKVKLQLSSAVSVCILAVLAILTWRQIGYWHSDVELWTHTLEVTKVNYLAEANLAAALRDTGRVQEALPHYQEAERLNPGQAGRHINLAVDLAENGDLQEAISEYQIAAELTNQPRTLARVHESIAALSAALGDYRTVRESYEQAWLADPDHRQQMIQALLEDAKSNPTAGGYYSLGFLLEKAGNLAEARQSYEEALKLNPEFGEAKQALAALPKANP
jgi:Flp pilus assembly protein TadD